MKKAISLLFLVLVLVASISAKGFWETVFGQSEQPSAFASSVSLVQNPAGFEENVGNAVITVERTGGTEAFSVDYTTLDNSATAGSDYTLTQGTLNFAADEMTKQILVPILDDPIAEGNEHFAVQLSNATNGVTLSNSFAFYQINPDDPVFVIFPGSSEESADVTIHVFRQGRDLNSVATVNFATSDDTAIAGQDYVAQNGTLTFAANETFKTVTVSVINNTVIEPQETFFVTISNPSAGTTIVGTNPATYTIIDDDQQYVSIQNANSGNPITEGNNAVFNVTRGYGDLTQPLTVDFTTADGDATSPADYTAQNGTVTFAANETEKTITVATINDFTTEPNEDFIVFISNPTNGAIVTNSTGTATLTDNNSTPTPTPTPTDPRVAFVTDRDGDDEIYGIDIDQTDLANISNLSATFDTDPDFNFINGKFVFRCEDDICIMNADGTNRSVLATGGFNPSWSPNGRYVVFSADSDGLRVVDTTDNSVTNIATGLITSNPRFSPDNSKIAFSGTANSFLHVVNRDGTNLTQLTTNAGVAPHPTWSPDGTKIVFEMQPTGVSVPDIFTINSDGTSLTNLTNSEFDYDQHATFSPDGTKILFSESGLRLRTITPSGTPIATLGAGKFPNWSPNGTKIVCLDDIDGQNKVKVLDAAGSNPIILQTNNIRYELPLWIGVDAAQPTIVGFETAASVINEADGTAQITVTRTGNTLTAFDVDYAFTNGTAINGDDFTGTNGTLNFAIGETSKTISVPIIDDPNPESAETFNLDLTNPTSGVTLTTASHEVTILANDLPTIQFTTSLTNVSEDAGTVTIEVTRSGNLTGASSVRFGTYDGTATFQDYTPTGRLFTFAVGESSKTVQVSITNDTLFEPAERFSMQLFDLSGAFAGATTFAEVEIATSDTVPVVQFNSVFDIVNEGPGNTIFNAGIRRVGNLTDASTVEFTTVPTVPCETGGGGCATAGQDYTPTTVTVTFAPGEDFKIVPVTILDDNSTEDHEFFSLLLRNPGGGAILGNPIRRDIQIRQNDVWNFNFPQANVFVNEHDSTVTVTVNKSSLFGNPSPSSVDYSTSNGSATSGADYTSVNGTLNFAANEFQKSFTIPILQDGLFEDNETFNVILSNPVNGGVGSSSTVTIVDNEPRYAIPQNFYSVNEGVGHIGVTIIRDKIGTSGTVSYTTADGTATTPGDYALTSGTVSFAAGDSSKIVQVPILSDSIIEGVENFSFSITGSSNGAIDQNRNTTQISIVDDDTSAFFVENQSYFAIEETGNIAVKVKRNTSSVGFPAFVTYETVNGSATSPADYTATAGTLNFGIGVSEMTINIPIVADNIEEQSENFSFRITTPTNGVIISAQASTNIRIRGLPQVHLPNWTLNTVSVGGLLNGKNLLGIASNTITKEIYVAADGFQESAASVNFLDSYKKFGFEFAKRMEKREENEEEDESKNQIPSNFELYKIAINGTVSLIDTYSIEKNSIGLDIEFNPNDGHIYTVGGQIVYRINPTTGVMSVYNSNMGVPNGFQNIEFNPAGELIYMPGEIGVFPFYRINAGFGSSLLGTADNSIIRSDSFGIQPDGDYVPYSDAFPGDPHSGEYQVNKDTFAVTPLSQTDIRQLGSPLAYSRGAVNPVNGDVFSFGVGSGGGSSVILYTSGSTNFLERRDAPAGVTVPFVTDIGNGFVDGLENFMARGVTDADFGPRRDNIPGQCLYFIDDFTDFVYQACRSFAPTAANVSVSGRITTASGRGIRNVAVMLTDPRSGEVRQALSSTFGYYQFAEVPAGRSYVISVRSKRFVFNPDSRLITVNDELNGVDFITANSP